jgi:hypothetical protein
MIIGINIIRQLFNFDVPKSVVSIFLCFFKNKMAINAAIITPLPSRITDVKMKIQVGNCFGVG